MEGTERGREGDEEEREGGRGDGGERREGVGRKEWTQINRYAAVSGYTAKKGA